MLRTRSLPRLAASTIRRPRLERWLSSHASTPLRLIVAPAGSGKTTLLLKYIRETPIDAGYCALSAGASVAELHEAIASAMNLPGAPQSHADLLAAMREAASAEFELIIDDADNASEEALAELRRLPDDLPETFSLVLASRSRSVLDARTWIARGLAVLCDGARLAFDQAEAQVLAEACGVTHTQNDLTRLLDESEGWAIVVSGSIRCAAEDARSLTDCFERWRVRYGQPFAEFIAGELELAPEEDRDLVRGFMAGTIADDDQRLEHLETRGLFVLQDENGYRPYRVLRHVRGSGSAQRAVAPPLLVRMFGHFEARIEGREIPWVRRRDQQLIKYLLLKPNASAARPELSSVFWPEADAQLASQSLRTACSNIRKAIGFIAGYAQVDRYFRADPDVYLDLGNVVADVRRFSAHVADGDSAFDRGDLTEAAARYRAAEQLYAGRLLDADPPEAWFSVQAQLLEDRYIIILERLAQMAFDEGDIESAAGYAQRVRQVRPDSVGLVEKLGRVGTQYRIRRA